MENKDLYYVAVKVFLRNKKGKLLITKDRFNDGWDIPGGRLKPNDFETPLEQVIERKINEELGDELDYRIDAPIVFMRHERLEVLSSGEKAERRIFAVGYKAEYLSGEVMLGKNHIEHQWVDIKNFIPENYFNGGWLKGVKEYIQKIRN
ncbi:NUDIX domain-containing protein [Patescibacteria group bacterium]|nr:NUDIX domain-containing protein [Patescibacteria group bacterium]MBU1890387.1 NUDIX domain-containing protein [Patescibacteria group bacterium]